MYEIARELSDWQAGGRRFVLVRTLEIEGFGQRWPLDALAVDEDGQSIGSVLGGLARSEVVAAARELLSGDREPLPADSARLLAISASDQRAVEAGLVCGGTSTLILQREARVPDALWPLLGAGETGVLFTTVDGAKALGSLVISADGTRGGTLGDPALDKAAADKAYLMLRTGRSNGEEWSVGETRLHAVALFPVPEIVIVGNGQLAEAISRAAETLEWRATVAATADEACEVLARLGKAGAVLILSHDLELAAPSLAAALSSGAGYVGAVGSRKTQSGRTERLKELGVPDDAIARIHGPAGLDLGARTPAEIALAVCAEILAEREGGSREPLSKLTGSIHRGPAVRSRSSAG